MIKVLQPAINTLTPPTSTWGPVPIAWQQAVAQQQAYNQNQQLAASYLEQFTDTWLVQYQSGRMKGPTGIIGDPDAAPPIPPQGFVVLYDDELNTCTLAQIGPPVCGVPAYQKIPPPQTPAQAAQMLQTLGANPFTSSAPLYTQVVAPDGSKWVRVG